MAEIRALPVGLLAAWTCAMCSVPCPAGEQTGATTAPALEKDFHVALPDELRAVPEPAGPGQRVPGFKIRGIKGWRWSPEQYLAEIPVLARYKMNFLMNCYLSMFDIENARGGGNRWWEPLPDAKKRKYEKVVQSCKKHGIEFCFAMHPNLGAKRMLDYESAEDLDALWRHYEWMAELGVNWFSVCLDDIKKGIDPAGQARLVNELLRRLRTRNPNAQMVFCPTFYMGTGVDNPKAREYLPVLARRLHPDVYCFWTGHRVVGDIRRAHAEVYKSQIKHRLIVWDNYPVNDNRPTLHLGPVTRRDRDLCEVVDGYMANPHCTESEINRIPLITQADYAYNPFGYDPARSIGQAIGHLGDTPEQRAVLKDLVELYPGMLLEQQKATGWNPVLARFREIIARPHSRYLADVYLRYVKGVAARLDKAYPGRFRAARRTVGKTIAQMKWAYDEKYRR